jgi:inosine/xanthosine triphosphatase
MPTRESAPSGAAQSLGATFRPSPSLVDALGGAAIRVGTENRAKLGAVRDAFGRFASADAVLELVPVGVASDVPEQPVGWTEIVRGARNRARAALASGECALAVGIEDGLVRLADTAGAEDSSDDVYNVGCAWITDGERDGHGFSPGFAYPGGALGPALRDRAPIGDLFDDHWSARRDGDEAAAGIDPSLPSGRSGGNIGRLTGGRLDRSAYGAHAVVCAMIRFLHTDLYD